MPAQLSVLQAGDDPDPDPPLDPDDIDFNEKDLYGLQDGVQPGTVEDESGNVSASPRHLLRLTD